MCEDPKPQEAPATTEEPNTGAPAGDPAPATTEEPAGDPKPES